MSVPVEDVVKHLESHGLLRTNKISNNYYQIYCPFHSNGQEKKPSCGILLHDEVKNGSKYPAGWCHCFACGYAKSLPQMVSDLLKLHGISSNGLDWLKENIPGFSGAKKDFEYLLDSEMLDSLSDNFNSDKLALSYIQSLKSKSANYITEEELQRYRFTVPYMYERGLTDELIEKFDIGFDQNFTLEGRPNSPIPSITFPVRDKYGNTLFICRRSVEGKFFNYPTDVIKPLYGIYELPENCDTVVVCESCFNALTSWRYGRPAVALLGTGNDYQIQQLKSLGVKEYILALDPDYAGRKATRKLEEALKDVAIVWKFDGIPEGKDLNDLTENEFNSLELV